MFKKKHLVPLQAVLWTGFVLAMLLPVLGLLGPRPGAPLDERSLGVGEFWLIRIVETATPSGASWVMETNWLNLLLCATVGGVAITWRIYSYARKQTGSEVMGLKAHVGFAIPDTKEVVQSITAHFNRLGYQAIEHGSHHWVFQRGKRSAVLWRFDIRAYLTTLTVKATPRQDGNIWIGCDWEVYTFMSITTGGDVRTLEAEGRELESTRRGAA